jgi:hypothetical protein
MTVPDDAPQTVKWADRMAQALQIAGGDVTTLRMAHDPDGKETEIWGRLQRALRELDAIREEIARTPQALDAAKREMPPLHDYPDQDVDPELTKAWGGGRPESELDIAKRQDREEGYGS